MIYLWIVEGKEEYHAKNWRHHRSHCRDSRLVRGGHLDLLVDWAVHSTLREWEEMLSAETRKP